MTDTFKKIANHVPFLVHITPVTHQLSDMLLNKVGYHRLQPLGLDDDNRFNHNRIRFLLSVSNESDIQPLKILLRQRIHDANQLTNSGTWYDIRFVRTIYSYKAFGVRWPWTGNWRSIAVSIGRYQRAWSFPFRKSIVITEQNARSIIKSAKETSPANFGWRQSGQMCALDPNDDLSYIRKLVTEACDIKN